MGDPTGKLRRKFKKPFRPYDKTKLEEEKEILKEFGLRRKKELWRAEGLLRSFRRRARNLLAERNEKKEKELFERLQRLGLLKNERLEDVLSLENRNLLERRLQTLVMKKGLANKIMQSRQLIVHGHVRVQGRVVKWPSYLVTVDEEDKITSDVKLTLPRPKGKEEKAERQDAEFKEVRAWQRK